jgi:hypothetical protein
MKDLETPKTSSSILWVKYSLLPIFTPCKQFSLTKLSVTHPLARHNANSRGGNVSIKIDGVNEMSQFEKWAENFLQIIEQIHYYESSHDLNPQLQGLQTKRDFEFQKITTGVTSIQKAYEESVGLLSDLQQLRDRYPNAFREVKIEFLTLICKTEEIYNLIHKLSDGGIFTYNGRKALHGWIKKEFDNIFTWIRNSEERKKYLFDFLTDDLRYMYLQGKCYKEKTLNLPLPPTERTDFNNWLRKYRSYNKKELDKILLQPED